MGTVAGHNPAASWQDSAVQRPERRKIPIVSAVIGDVECVVSSVFPAEKTSWLKLPVPKCVARTHNTLHARSSIGDVRHRDRRRCRRGCRRDRVGGHRGRTRRVSGCPRAERSLEGGSSEIRHHGPATPVEPHCEPACPESTIDTSVRSSSRAQSVARESANYPRVARDGPRRAAHIHRFVIAILTLIVNLAGRSLL